MFWEKLKILYSKQLFACSETFGFSTAAVNDSQQNNKQTWHTAVIYAQTHIYMAELTNSQVLWVYTG